MAVVVFALGSAIQAGAISVGMVFAGRAVAGLAVGMLTMIVPMYMSEVSTPGIRGTLVVLQQLSITLGILVSYWLEFGTAYIGGHRCAPEIPELGGSASSPTLDRSETLDPIDVLDKAMRLGEAYQCRWFNDVTLIEKTGIVYHQSLSTNMT